MSERNRAAMHVHTVPLPAQRGAIRDRLNRILAKHTGQSIEKIARDTDRDNFMSGEAAATYGLIDRVLEQREQVPVTGSK